MTGPVAIARGRAALWFGALLAAAMLASVGCVTLDDRDTVEAGASGEGQGGSSAKGGSGGSSAKGGTGGTSKGGDGGSSAAGGTGGGGQGGSGGTSTNAKCGDEVNVGSARLRSCIYSMSCNPLQPGATMSDCVTYGMVYDCEATAKSCADVAACTGVAREPDSLCGPDEVGWRCEGDVAIRCGAVPVYSVDCGRIASSCDLFESEQKEELWPCKLESPASCDENDPTSQTCVGNTYYSCIDGKAYGMDCSVLGLSCVTPLPGQAFCTDRQVACDASKAGVVSCAEDLTRIEVCDPTLRSTIYDCGPAGATCHVEGTSDGYCLSPGCTADSVCDEQCIDATHMQICVGSAPYTVDCTDYGFVGCVAYANHPVTGKPYVECQPAP